MYVCTCVCVCVCLYGKVRHSLYLIVLYAYILTFYIPHRHTDGVQESEFPHNFGNFFSKNTYTS